MFVAEKVLLLLVISLTVQAKSRDSIAKTPELHLFCIKQYEGCTIYSIPYIISVLLDILVDIICSKNPPLWPNPESSINHLLQRKATA